MTEEGKKKQKPGIEVAVGLELCLQALTMVSGQGRGHGVGRGCAGQGGDLGTPVWMACSLNHGNQ